MPVTFTLPDGFEFLGASFVSTVFLLFFQSTLVSKYRKSAGIPYPQVYADKTQVEGSKDANKFNCAQRAHQNTLENLPVIYVTTLVTGLKFPVIAASALGLWTISRVSYTRGYVSGDPAKRVTPFYMAGMLTTVGLLATSTYISGMSLFQGIYSRL